MMKRRMRRIRKGAGSAVRYTVSRVLLASLATTAALPLAAPRAARAAELVPSVGLTRAVDSDEAKSQIGLALRGSVLPGVLQSELGVGYRRDEYSGGALEVKQIPVTASLLLTPIPTLHGDAGVGWYNTRLDYQNPLLEDETTQKFGVHVGGGFKIPLAPVAALDVTGRYVFMQEQESRLIPNTFDPDYWTLSLGLAFRL